MNRFNKALCVGLLSLSEVAMFAGSSAAETADMKTHAGDHAFLGRALGVNQLELQLGQLASQRATTSEVTSIYDRVASQSGGAFDSVFKQVVDAGHVKELAMYQDEVRRATSPELRELAQRRVTTLTQSIARADAPTSTPVPTPEW